MLHISAMSHFFQKPPYKHPHLKICGITTLSDAQLLVDHGVEALGFNFWQQSKRYISPENASNIATKIKGKILRVGVFVNAEQSEIYELLKNDVIDIAQLHGDEDVSYCQEFAQSGYPFIKAIGVSNADSLKNLEDYRASAILLDAHAPEVYGGTGDTFDWNLAKTVIAEHQDLPVILAGGITQHNASNASSEVNPCALDVASGAEISPGIKDFGKVTAIQNAIRITS